MVAHLVESGYPAYTSLSIYIYIFSITFSLYAICFQYIFSNMYLIYAFSTAPLYISTISCSEMESAVIPHLPQPACEMILSEKPDCEVTELVPEEKELACEASLPVPQGEKPTCEVMTPLDKSCAADQNRCTSYTC